MNIEEYQLEINKFAVYPEANTFSDLELHYLTMGLCSEAGEFAGKIKKKIRDGNFDFDAQAAQNELGDVLWYLTKLASFFQIYLEELAAQNYDKLSYRFASNTIKGSGDSR